MSISTTRVSCLLSPAPFVLSLYIQATGRAHLSNDDLHRDDRCYGGVHALKRSHARHVFPRSAPAHPGIHGVHSHVPKSASHLGDVSWNYNDDDANLRKVLPKDV